MNECANCGSETCGWVCPECHGRYVAYLDAQAAADAAMAAARLQERGRVVARRQARAIIKRPARRR